MNKKQLFFLIIILVISLAGWYLLRTMNQEEVIKSPTALDFASLQKDNVTKLTLGQGIENLILEKTSDG